MFGRNHPDQGLQASNGFGYKAMGRVLPQCLRSIELHSDTIDQNQNAIRYGHGFFWIMGDHYGRRARAF